MSKQTKIIIASVAALLVIILAVLCYFVFLGERVKCNFCEEMYFENQGKVAPLFGMMCPNCYEEFLAEFGGDDDDNDNDNSNSNNNNHNDNGGSNTPTDNQTPNDPSVCKHNNVITVEGVDPTCTEEGYTWSRYCEDCNEVFVEKETIPVIDCIEGAEIVDKQTTKTQDGKTHTECTMCGKTISEFVIGKGSQGLKFELNSDGTYAVIDLGNCTDKDIVIPTVYYNIPVTTIGESAFAYYDTIKSITVSEGITTIEAEAFEGCELLTNVYLPNTLITIGDCAFFECKLLKSIAIPDSVINIGGGLFYNCSSLQTVTLNNNLAAIKSYKAFWGYYGMFENCTSLKSISLPDTITSIEEYAFSGCSSLKEITVGDNVVRIKDYAFYGCTSLASISIGKSVVRIDYCAFDSCELLTNITFRGTKPQWESIYKDEYWDYNTGKYTVYCTDGSISKTTE